MKGLVESSDWIAASMLKGLVESSDRMVDPAKSVTVKHVFVENGAPLQTEAVSNFEGMIESSEVQPDELHKLVASQSGDQLMTAKSAKCANFSVRGLRQSQLK